MCFLEVEENQATIRSGGKTETINLQEAQHFDSALVLTTCEKLGKTADYVLWTSDLTGAENFYVAVSRAKYGLKIFTDNKRELLEKALLSRKNVNPRELLGIESLDQASSTDKLSPGAVEETVKQQTQKQEREGQHLQPSRGLRI